MRKIKDIVVVVSVIIIFFVIYLISCFVIVFASNINNTLAMLIFNLFIGVIVSNFYRFNGVVHSLSDKNIYVKKSEKQISFEIQLILTSYILMFFLLIMSGGMLQDIDIVELKTKVISILSKNSPYFILLGIILFLLIAATMVGLSSWSYRVIMYKGEYYVTIRSDKFLIENYKRVVGTNSKKQCPSKFKRRLNKR